MECELESDPGRYRTILEAAFARHYAEGSDVWTRDREMTAFPEVVRAQHSVPSTARVLDVGCGAGRDVEYFAAHCAKVLGIDLHAHPNWTAVGERLPNVTFLNG